MTRLKIHPHFTQNKKAEALFTWQKRRSEIKNQRGENFFKSEGLEFPSHWSQLSVDITASKYFRESKGKPETSLKHLVSRVSRELKKAAIKQKYLNSTDASVFENELKFILYSQRAAFNSPVWFNLGIFDPPQSSACFIQSIDDSIESIFDLLKNEGLVFKYGSGSGTNFSKLRSHHEKLDSGGFSSGLMPFLNVFDAAAGAIKSGGITRRAAKMVIVDIDHPEIEEFIELKSKEEEKAQKLIQIGMSAGLDGEVQSILKGQNANNSVRVTDRFMKAVLKNQTWSLRSRVGGRVIKKVGAKELWRLIAVASHRSADPGLQFHDTINKWNTCQASGAIVASNPCSEFMFLNDTSCNLASLNLSLFLSEEGQFLLDDFRHTVKIIFLAQELLVDLSKYPTEKIKINSLEFRPLGLGFTNLGSFFLKLGLPYDSAPARSWASAVTSLLTSEAYANSIEFAKIKGPFKHFTKNKGSFLKVIQKHKAANSKVKWSDVTSELKLVCAKQWAHVYASSQKVGVRNAQATVIAPTGTISFFMGADTTGIEPEFSFLKSKKMVTGIRNGPAVEIEIINKALAPSLRKLDYTEDEIKSVLSGLSKTGEIRRSDLKSDLHYKVFQTAIGSNAVSPESHLMMMSAVQPFVSGAISKTINLPESASVDDVENIHWLAWTLGLKSVAIYRDKSKFVQPLQTKTNDRLKCGDCGHETVLRGGCFVCTNCGLSVACG